MFGITKNPDKARPNKTRQDKTRRYPDKKVSPGLKNTVHVSVNRANDGSGNYLLYIRCKANNWTNAYLLSIGPKKTNTKFN